MPGSLSRPVHLNPAISGISDRNIKVVNNTLRRSLKAFQRKLPIVDLYSNHFLNQLKVLAMKKLFIIAAVLIAAGFSSVSANTLEPEVGKNVRVAFNKQFPDAAHVSWKEGAQFYTATFSLNEQGFSAYFDRDGRFLGTTRNILFSQLPIPVMKAVTDRYDLAQVSGLFEFNNGESSEYFMHVAKKNRKYLVKISSSGTVSTVKRIKS